MSGQIKPISKLDVHKICSGQVVLNLATAVKELIENSLDAGATSVGLKLKEFGKDMVEVTDNGAGVHPDNFEGLALKHHTSKIQDFADLTSVETFGFRGEALSSLCALSDVTVTTRHSSQSCGTKLVFDCIGNIKLKVPIAKQIGTSVTLSNLFSSLPVRHKEFHRNLKKEFGKMIQVVTGYCLVATQVKVSCVNQTKSSNNVILSTHGSKTVIENISCIYGSKQANNLLAVTKVVPEDEDSDAANIFELDGYVSSCDHSCGRSSKDRQFYFINSRPCEPLKIIKAVNEVYHQYNQNQYPFVYLNITIARAEVDVNVTPDKRQIFLSNEKCLISIIKASLNSLFKDIPSTYKINTTLYESITVKRPSELNNENNTFKYPKLDTGDSDANNETLINSHAEQIKNKLNQLKSDKCKAVNTIDNFFQKTIDSIDSNLNNQIEKVEENLVSANLMKCTKIFKVKDKENKFDELKLEIIDNNKKEPTATVNLNSEKIELTKCSQLNGTNSHCSQYAVDLTDNNINERLKQNIATTSPSKYVEMIREDKINESKEKSVENDRKSTNYFVDNSNINQNTKIYKNSLETITEKTYNKEYNCEGNSPKREIDTSVASKHRKSTEVEISLEQIKQQLKTLQLQKFEKKKVKTRFYATIDPDKNAQAENELSREISKDMFSKMTIVGQFNLGFIITKLDADLFIVDQHATDEKYNFETLQKTTKITSQKLVIPQQLELTAVNEIVLLDSINIFQMNGFDFEFQHNAEPTKKVKLTKIPMSNNWRFGKEDVDELLFMLQDAPNTLCRPSRVRSMFASRACRKSVMIGTVLSLNDMRKLIDNMGVIEQPWNCPHGRPTMRHLVNLSLLNDNIK